MSASGIPIVIDGPNFINRILDMRIDKDIISKQLILTGLTDRLNMLLEEKGMKYQTELLEFVCSKRLFGSGSSKFDQKERDIMIRRFMTEKGVHVEEVSLPGTSEKGVDITVSSLLESFAENYEKIILISDDRDYVPVLNKMRKKRNKIILCSLNEHFPVELSNEAYLTVNLYDEYRHFFTYCYPVFSLHGDFTIEKMKELISNADDRQHNQLRVDTDGDIYFSHEYVGNQNIDVVKFRYETLGAYNEYVGPKAASDKKYVGEEYEDVIYGWQTGARGYFDYPIRDS